MFADSINALGNWFSSLKRYNMADECYAIAHKKGCNMALYNRGSTLCDVYSIYSRAKSKKYIDEIVEGNKNCEKDQLEMIENAEQLNKLKKAEKLLLRYIEKCPDDSDGYLCMSNIYEFLSDYTKARHHRIMSMKYGNFYTINRILVFTETNGELAEIAYQMFIKLFKQNETTYYTNVNSDVLVEKPIDMTGWTERTLNDYQIKEIDGCVLNGLGMKFSTGSSGVTLNHRKAHKLFKLALKLEYKYSYYNVASGYIHSEGIDYVDRDKYKRKALKLLESGSEKGEQSCNRELGRIYDPDSKMNDYNFVGIVDKNKEKAIAYYKIAAGKKDWFSCLEMIKHLQNTEGKSFGNKSKKMYYNDDISKKQMNYLFDYLSSSESGYDTPKNVEVPFNVLEHMKTLITYKMKKLKKKIEELELRPPEEGGSLYIEASKSFNENIKKFN